MKPVLRIPAYRRLLAAYALNELAFMVGSVALALLVYGRTHSALGAAAFFLFAQVRGEFGAKILCFEDAADFVANTAEKRESFLDGAQGFCGIIESPVIPVELTGKNGARLVGIAADGNDSIYAARKKFVEMFGVMRGNIDANFRHDLDGERMDIARRARACALHVGQIAERVAQDAFADMAAAGVAGAEDKDGRFSFHG